MVSGLLATLITGVDGMAGSLTGIAPGARGPEMACLRSAAHLPAAAVIVRIWRAVC